MTETKFTKGPWKVNHIFPSVESERLPDPRKPWLNDHDFSVAVTVEGDKQLKEANAALIAAAPELYEALHEAVAEECSGHACGPCKYAVDGYETCRAETGRCFVRRWMEVLAKARGEVQG